MEISQDREKYIRLIIDSNSPKKLIVAGPGTGKTFAFHETLSASGGRGLALTFINNLVRDLRAELSDVADAYTFHGFCKYLMHRFDVEALASKFHYYPPLPILFAEDFNILGHDEIDTDGIEKCLHNLDDTKGTVSEVLRLGNYYDAVGYTDSVYRVLRHLEDYRSDIPQYPLVVVDEYQDFSLLETTFIGLLAERNPVLIAGDDDQALYGFKHASAKYIRELERDPNFEKFQLPYCSRCTEIIMGAVEDVINKAEFLGLLRERIEKPLICYLPDKLNDSQIHPHIIHAHCTVERRNAPYIGRYIASEIEQIPVDDIIESREGGYPTALVIGPIQFVRRVYDELRTKSYEVELRESKQLEVSIVEGYRFLMRDQDSRLGWRIILHCDPFEGVAETVALAISGNSNLASMIAEDYKKQHRAIVKILEKLMCQEPLTNKEQLAIESRTGLSFDDIKVALSVPVEDIEEDVHSEPSIEDAGDISSPKIVCTSLRGAKGLSASYVFMVGLNNGHFPRDPTSITDDEICCFIVGLSRTRKRCYMVSCGRFGNQALQPSEFLEWIQGRLSYKRVDASYLRSLAN